MNKPRIVALFGARVLFGQERANIEALAALKSEGCAVLCVIRPEPWPELLQLREALNERGLRWVAVPYIDYPIRGWLLHAARWNPGAFVRGNVALTRILRSFRATHIHAFNPLYVASFFIAIALSRQPMIYRSGDRPEKHNLFYKMTWSFIKRRAAYFVADSQFIRGRLRDIGIPFEKMTVLYSPPPSRSTRTILDLPALPLEDDSIRFVFAGRVTAAKGVDVLVSAFTHIAGRFENVQLVIAGHISDWAGDDWARQLRDRVGRAPEIAGRVHFVGFVENVPELFRLCHVHVAPSIAEEALGLVVMEAKSVGRPSIVFASGGLAELVEDGVDGRNLAEKSCPALASAMQTYALNPQLAKVHGVAAAASMGRFRFYQFSRNWLHVYESARGRDRLMGLEAQ